VRKTRDARGTAENTGFLRLIVGYDGSPPAIRALDAAVQLLANRAGDVDVVYVAHLPSVVMLSADAVAEMETDFDEIEAEIRAEVAGQMGGRAAAWQFERRQGAIADELVAVAAEIRPTQPGETVVIVVGSSSNATRRGIGSVAVGLARRSPVPLVIVP
jgi:nucleotide-binding universal stress UspA family protein